MPLNDRLTRAKRGLDPPYVSHEHTKPRPLIEGTTPDTEHQLLIDRLTAKMLLGYIPSESVEYIVQMVRLGACPSCDDAYYRYGMMFTAPISELVALVFAHENGRRCLMDLTGGAE